MTKRQVYEHVHLLGKIINALFIMVLADVVLVRTVADIGFLDVVLTNLTIAAFIFGNNTFSYMVETLEHKKHKHRKF